MILGVLSLFVMALTANAQIGDEIQKSKERAEKLQALCDSYKPCGDANIDGFGEAVRVAAIDAIANSEKLENLYTREIGETADGVTDVTVTKPTIEDWTSLLATMTEEGAAVATATQKAQSAAEELKNMTSGATKSKNPAQAAKAAKAAQAATAVVDFGTSALPILAEESAAQVKAVETIIETLKSGKNL